MALRLLRLEVQAAPGQCQSWRIGLPFEVLFDPAVQEPIRIEGLGIGSPPIDKRLVTHGEEIGPGIFAGIGFQEQQL